jgi:hypothetical protein
MLLTQPPPPVSLSVSPARIAVTAPASRTITLRNTGAQDVVVEVTRRAAGESAAFKSWVHVAPQRQRIPAGRIARFTLRVRRNPTATPGDHASVVLLTTSRPQAEGIGVRLRLGVRLMVRVPGRLVRRIDIGRLRLRRRTMIVWVVNRGNLVVPLAEQASATLRRRGHFVALLRPRAPALLLPRGRLALAFPYPRRLRGVFRLEVRVGGAVRRFWVRL